MLIPKKAAISKKRNSVTLLVPLIFKSSIYILNNVKTKLENKDCGYFYIFPPINFNCYDITSVLESRQYFT